MNRCQHGQKIVKFCVTQHCHHKEAAGCQYCMKRYHFHLTNTLQLSQSNIEQMIKKVTLPTDSKYKTRILQEASIQYLRNIKNSINNWLEQAQNAIADRLSHPMLRKQGLLPTYNRLKYRQYRKIHAKDLRNLNQFAKNASPQELKKDEIKGYFQEVEWTTAILDAAQKIANQLVKLPEVKQGEGPISTPSKNKAKQVLDSIGRQMNKKQAQDKVAAQSSATNQNEYNKFANSGIMARRMGNNNNQHKHNHNPSILVKEQQGPKKEPEGLDVLTNILFGEEKKKRKLERRRSSIDQKLDFKFGNDVNQKAKQIEERKKKIIDDVKNQKEKKQQDDDRIIGQNLLDLKFGKVSSHKQKQKEEEKKLENTSTQKTGSIKDEGSHEKFNQGLGLLEGLIDNILPPIPDPPTKEKQQEPIGQKLVKIPVFIRDNIEQIQSPIWKKKNQTIKQESSGFGIKLNQVSDKVVEKEETKDKLKESKEIQKPSKKTIQKDEDQVIVLGLNEKYSLLLFSQSLKCESQRAIELLKAALKYSPNNLSAAEYLSYLYLEGGRAKECLEVCESIILKIQDTPQEFELTLHLHNNRAAALNMLGRYSQSIMVLQKCLRSRRKHYFYKNLADAYFCLGIPEKASMNYEKAVKLDPQYDEAFYNLAVTQFMQQEYTSALFNIGQAVRIDGQNQNYQELEIEIKKRKANCVI